jgi:hypothetical protein
MFPQNTVAIKITENNAEREVRRVKRVRYDRETEGELFHCM